MVSVTQNDSHLTLGPNMECYNVEIATGQTLETGFGRIIGVVMTPEETQDATRAWGYSLSTSQITFTVDSTKTYTVLVIGYR